MVAVAVGRFVVPKFASVRCIHGHATLRGGLQHGIQHPVVQGQRTSALGNRIGRCRGPFQLSRGRVGPESGRSADVDRPVGIDDNTAAHTALHGRPLFVTRRRIERIETAVVGQRIDHPVGGDCRSGLHLRTERLLPAECPGRRDGIERTAVVLGSEIDRTVPTDRRPGAVGRGIGRIAPARLARDGIHGDEFLVGLRNGVERLSVGCEGDLAGLLVSGVRERRPRKARNRDLSGGRLRSLVLVGHRQHYGPRSGLGKGVERNLLIRGAPVAELPMNRSHRTAHEIGRVVFKRAELELPQRSQVGRRSGRHHERVDQSGRRRGCQRLGVTVGIDTRQRKGVLPVVGQSFDQAGGFVGVDRQRLVALRGRGDNQPVGVVQRGLGSCPGEEHPSVAGHGLEVRGRNTGRLRRGKGRDLHRQPVRIARLHGKRIGAVVGQILDRQRGPRRLYRCLAALDLGIVGRPGHIVVERGGFPRLGRP